MTDAIDLTTEQRKTLNDLLRRFLPGVVVWAYGSRVKWTARPNSDLDLVAFTTPAQCPQVAELKDALAESNLPFPVDLHVWDDVPERFRDIIRKEYVVVQEDKEPESGSGIADGWNSCTIGDLCDAGIVELRTGPFGTQLHAHDYVEDGVPVVPTEAIRNRQIDHSVLPKVASGKAEELARHRLERGDILFARRGVQATGHIGCVREAEEGFLCGTGAIRLRVREGGRSVNPDFLSHVLANPASVEWFKFHAIGATMPNLNEGIIRSFPLQIPPMAEQRAFAHILGTLDDKIELNRRINETLEAMARALFKSWFIDFDPVRRNAARARNQPSPPTPLPKGEGSKHYRGGYDFTGLVETARTLRKKQTPAEGLFWELVRDRRFMGLKFRRQHQMGDYIADFYCHEHHLVIEFDGGIHSAKRQKDHKRDAWMEAQGFTVLRFRNEQLLEDPEFILTAIAEIIQPAPIHPLPLGEGQGEGVVGGHAFDHLFPDSFKDSELGEIPRGWKVGNLGDIADHPRRSVQPNEMEPTTPYIALEHMPRHSIALSEWGAADGLESNKLKFKEGEILFGKLRPYFHKVGVAPVDGVCSTDIVVVTPRTEEWFGLVLGHISSDTFVEHTNASSTGTRMPRTSWSEMARYPMVVPPESVAKAFTFRTRPAVEHIIVSIHEAHTLTALRDTLLPKLISGEVRVKDAKQFQVSTTQSTDFRHRSQQVAGSRGR